jgi:hypothetical protein
MRIASILLFCMVALVVYVLLYTVYYSQNRAGVKLQNWAVLRQFSC